MTWEALENAIIRKAMILDDFMTFLVCFRFPDLNPNTAAKPCRLLSQAMQSPEQPWKTPPRFPHFQSGRWTTQV
jgi:hypothetical protein